MKDYIKKIMAIFFLIMLTITIPVSHFQVFGLETYDSIRYTIHVDDFNIQQKNGFDEINAEGFGRFLIPGKPNLPSKIVTIAIPPNAKILDVNFETSNRITLNGSYNIPPCDTPQSIGEETFLDDTQTIYDMNYNETYTTNEPYPEKVVELVRNSYFRKYDMVDVRVNPFSYYPVSGTLEYYQDITIIVNYLLSDDTGREINDNQYRKEVLAEKIICNYEQAKQWYQSSDSKNDELYDYVIITLDTLTSSVSSLADWETEKGRNVNVVSTSWIDSNYEGYDLQENIRNFLRDKYPSSEWGIEDVLIVGNYDDVPMRRCAQDMGYGKPETDYYYAELSLPDNQSWDSNGNHQYGEYADPIDFFAEINVGRIPSSDSSIVSSICNKTIFYEQTQDPSFKKNILLLGAFFWPNTDNAELMEEIAGNAWMDEWTMTRMYESQSSYPSDHELSYTNVETNWSSSTYAFVNWAGHGSPTACYEYYPSQPFVDIDSRDSLNDDYSAIIFADACSNQDTDAYNIGQAMMEHGAVGFLGSTKVAYGDPGWDSPYDGSSQSFDYFFTSYVTSCNYSAGQAHQLALSEMYSYGLWNYNYYETFEWGAYLGNPNMWMNISPMLAFTPQSYDFGLMELNETDQITIEIWNNGSGNLHYTLIEECDWLTLSETSGMSSGEHQEIILTVNTTGLNPGSHHYDILIDATETGKDQFSVDLYIPQGDEISDIQQNLYDRGFPIRHAMDGNWAAAQDFKPLVNYLTRVEILIRKFGSPEFDLVVELRENHPQGTLLDSIVLTPNDVSSNWDWLTLDFNDYIVSSETDYFIVVPPAPSGVTTSFGYEWAYNIGNPYPDGAFWFTRDGGSIWRDLPLMYEFAFRTFGFI